MFGKQWRIIGNTHASPNLRITHQALLTFKVSLQRGETHALFKDLFNLSGPVCITQ